MDGLTRASAILAAVACAVLGTTTGSALAQCELAKLTGSHPTINAYFGSGVAASGDVIVVGAPDYEDHKGQSGAAYIFRRNGTDWVEEAMLTSARPFAEEDFGRAVALSGNRAVIGTSTPNTSYLTHVAGGVYVFAGFNGTWVEETRLIPMDGPPIGGFGASVAASGDYVLVGAPYDSSEGDDAGAAYVFKRSGLRWSQEAKLTASDAAPGDYFGYVSVKGDVAVVGAPGNDEAGESAGAVYVFRITDGAWIEEAKLMAGDAVPGDWFGARVAVDGHYIIVGLYRDDDPGAAYIFRHDGVQWIEEARLAVSEEEADHFGSSVAIDGDIAVIGAMTADANVDTYNSGAAYVFQREGAQWIEKARLTASDAADSDCLGRSAAISNSVAIVGARHASSHSYGEGAAYVFGITGDCNANESVDLCDIAQGTSADCSGNGVPDECEPDCNDNGAPDTCDVVDGTGADCDHDEILDECETDHDADDDGVEDCLDGCPNDSRKVDPGQCGCGFPDADSDGDGTADCYDLCDDDPDKVDPQVCGCGIPDEGAEYEGTADCAPRVALIPVGATGPHGIQGSEIVLPGGGQTVTLEIKVSGWDPDLLKAYQAGIDSSGYTSGLAGTLAPLGWETGGFINLWRPDFVFYGNWVAAAVDVSLLDFRYGAVAYHYVEYVPPPKYGGTLRLVVPEGAAGTFEVGLRDTPVTDLVNASNEHILPVQRVPALITIRPPVCGNGECELGEDLTSCPRDCVDPDDDIPALSEWGAAILTLMLLTVGKAYFGRRQVGRPTH